VAVRGGDPVHAVYGDIGHIKGLVLGEDSRQVAYVLVQTARRLGRRNVAVPVKEAIRIDVGIQLGITKQEIRHLPLVSIRGQDQ
jgi:hypothetical protein